MEVATNNVPVKVEASNGPERSAKKSGKEDKSRRKDDKSIEQVMKALNVLETTEEKLAAMCKKYTEIVDENRKLQLAAKQWEKGLHTVQREKEQLQTDHSKAVLTRSRLESLCRELQRQNKQIKDESLLKVREEEEKRKEVSAKFNTTLAEITTLMSSSNEKTNLLRDENVEITKRFKSICDQSAIQQQQVDKMNTQRKLESELTEARLTKQRLEFTAEKEILLKEKQQLFMDIHTLHARINELEASETSLKGQVTLYADRYDEFQTALTKSNEVFGGFKGEMEKMSKKITRLEKETSTWKSRWEKSHQSFLEVVAEKSKCEGELSLANRKHAQLEKLCRTLQTERVLLLAQIKGLSQSQSTDGSMETETAHIESTLASAGVQHTACSMGKATAESPKPLPDESSSEKASESSNVETANGGDNLWNAHNSQETNRAQAAVDNVVGMMKTISVDGDLSVAPQLSPCGDSPKSQDDVNALTIDKTPASHVENQENKMGDDFHAVHKKGAKSRTGHSDTAKKTKPLSANDAKKSGIDNNIEKKDNTRVVNKTRHDSTSEKKDKKHKRERMGKSEIDSANEKQKKGIADLTDANRLAESVGEEKKDEPKVQGSHVESSVSVGATNISVNVDKKENIVDAKLIDTNIAEEKKLANALVNEASVPAKKPEFEKKVKIAGATNKMATEKKQVDKNIDLVEITNKEVADASSKENKVAEELAEKVVSAEVNIQPPVVGAGAIKVPEKESPNEESKVESKFGVLSYAKVSAKNIHVEKKVPDAVSTSVASISVNKDVPVDDKVSTGTLEADKSKVVSEPAKETEIEKVKDVRLTDKIPPAPSNDTKKVKTPEKPKRAEKIRVEGNKGSVDDKAVKASPELLPKLSDEGKKLDGLPASEPKAVASEPTPQIPVTQAEAAEPGPSEVTNAQQCSEVKKEKVVAKKRKK